MEKLIKMPSIEQFKGVVKNIAYISRFKGFDINENPIFENVKLPTLKAIGTVKLHGTNSSVCYNDALGIWFQSKNNIITPQNDNCKFASFFFDKKDKFIDMIKALNIDTTENIITIYGEWAGKGIQKSVAISEIEKSFYIFGIKISKLKDEESFYWLNDYTIKEFDNIHDIRKFKIFEIDIDFNDPKPYFNKMVEMMLEVEKECPVAKYFGISGIGEGIVFKVNYMNKIFTWKVKGEKHSNCKVKKLNKVDNEKLQFINNIAEKVTPAWRLDQMYQETFNTLNGGKGDIKKIGDYIKNVINDILKEELDTLESNNLTIKDISFAISKISREFMFDKLNEEVGL